MVKRTDGPIDLQRLLEVIDGAFDNCKRAHQVLHQKVQEDVVAVLMQSDETELVRQQSDETASTKQFSNGCFNEMLTLPIKPEKTLLMSENGLATLHASRLCEPLDYIEIGREATPDECARKLQRTHCGPRAISKQRVVVQPLVKTSAAVFDPNDHRATPTKYEDCENEASETNSHRSIPQSRASLQGDSQTRVSMKRSPTNQSGFSLGVFVNCTGTYTRVSSIQELPPWVRFSEKILYSDKSIVPELRTCWTRACQSSESDLGDIVQACKKANFLATVTRSYVKVSKSSRRSKRRGLRASLNDTCIECLSLFNLISSIRDLFPLSPSGRLRASWDAASFAVCFYDLILLPMVAFEFGKDAQTLRARLDVLATIFWSTDMVMSFLTAYFDGYVIIRSYAKISKAYVRSWFVLDLLIVLNDWLSVLLASSYSVAGISGRWLKTLKNITRCVRLVRLWKISSQVANVAQMLKSQVLLTAMKIFTHTVVVFVICHYFGCGFYALHSVGGVSTNWVEHFEFSDATPSFAYLTCLHWALTQLLPASMQVYPVNQPERIFNIAFIVVAMVLAAFYTSSIIVSMNHLRAVKSAAIERDNQLRKFMSQHEVSDEIAIVIWGCMSNRRKSVASKLSPWEVTAFKDMPEHVLERVYEETFLRHLQVHPLMEFFSNVDRQFMRKLCRSGIEQYTMPSAGILWHDLVPTRMLFVRRGVLLYDDDTIDADITVQPLEWCCEEAIWGNQPRLQVPFFAGIAGCELLMVNPETFEICAKDENSFLFLGRYAEEFIRRFVEASYDNETMDYLFNCHGSIHQILRIAIHSMQRGASMAPSEDSDD